MYAKRNRLREPAPAAVAAAIIAVITALNASPAAAQTPAPKPHATARAGIKNYRGSLSHNVGIHGPVSGPIPASAACGRQVAVTNGPQGQLGPNGAGASSTLVSIPVTGGNTAAATQQNSVAQECAHTRH